MESMKRKAVEVSRLKAIEEGPGGFEGYASVFEVVDSYNEATVKGCFMKHLQAFIDEGFLAEGHDWRTMGHGYIESAREDEYGLYVKFVFFSDDQSQALRKKVNERIAAGKKVKLSIGYYLRDFRMVTRDDKTSYMALTEVELKEVSLVTVPANPAAEVITSKSFDETMSFEDHAKMAAYGVASFAQRCKDRVSRRENEAQRGTRAGAELSAQNVALIDGVIDAIDQLDAAKSALKDLADRNRKDSENESGSKGSETEPSSDVLFAEFHKRNADIQSLLTGAI